ncbi:MAG: RNA polymerase sigma factor [Roseburia sp.]
MCQEPFTQMVHKYQNLVFSICVKMTGDYFAAEDLTQETFLSAYRHKEEFDGKNEKAWLCRNCFE